MTIDLAVRLSTSRTDRHVTADLRDLTFRETAVGGFAHATMSLDRPLHIQPDEIAYYGRVYVYDARNGRTVWEGRLEDPGRGARGDGTVWRLTAMGPAAHAHDRTVPLVYADRRLDAWVTANAAARYIQMSRRVREGSGAEPVLQAQVPRNTVWVNGHVGRWAYRAVADAGMALGRVSASWDTGSTSADQQVRLGTDTTFTGFSSLDTDTWNTAGGTLAASRGGSPAITAGHTFAFLDVIRNTSNLTVADETVWAELYAVVVRGLLKDAAGADITTGYTLDTVLASQVVADLLGRLLTAYDGAAATVATTTYPIEQLAYPDGTDAARVLDDLMKLEPAFRWGAYESNTAGKHRFEWVAWPSTVRYEVDATDGFDSPGSADGLYNAVAVRWVDELGQVRTNRRTSTVGVLTDAGLTREAFVDLGDEVGTSGNADRAGDQFLAEHQFAPNAGRLVVARPVLDLDAGRMVMPWEIRPGHLIRVRGVLPRVDALNATARDGATVFRVWSREYSTAAAAATLELDSYAPSTARALADAKPVITRRR